ncbi:MAG: DEAD/DEAH box helicase [Marinilabiliaceae bacterium]|jgi:ATP-dependent RNA helicase RhlE|nr:DEAD/DEAH box helicase [Marinilabiliaceae bacterium]
MRFEDYRINEEIKKNISELAYKKPTDIQYKSIPPILKGEDVLAIAQTGTGKTAAFAIPVIDIINRRKLKARRPDGVLCLIMVPTHELALQTESVFKALAANTRVNAYAIHGGVEQDPQVKQLERGVDILIATPGRMFDLHSQEKLRLNRVSILILDEADHMLDLGFIKDIRDLIKYIPKQRQTLFFSATISEKIKKLAYSLVTNPIRIEISPKDPVARNIDHSVAFIEMDDKRFFLEAFIRDNPDSKILVFVRTKIRAERVMKALERVDIKSSTIHSDKQQSERKRTMDNFRGAFIKVLIATDVSARGIDIHGVDYVVNYDLPESGENYVHRVGRTGRGDKKGMAISFCSTEEKELLAKIEERLGKQIQKLLISRSDYELTKDLSQEKVPDWKALYEEDERLDQEHKSRHKSKPASRQGRGKRKK